MPGPRILLVDDERSILQTMSAILHAKGFEVVAAASVTEAHESLAREKFDLVITDLKMDNCNGGYEVLQKALQQPNRPATLLITAYPPPAEVWKEKGAQGLVEKPMDLSMLFAEITRLVNRG